MEPESKLFIYLFGPFQVTRDDHPIVHFKSNKVRALLAYLAAESNRHHSRGTLAGLLWPEWPEKEARSNLRYALSDLRTAIGDRNAAPPFLNIFRETIQFNRKSIHWLDVSDFTELTAKEDNLAVDVWERAVDLYKGDFLEGFSISDSPGFEAWALQKREYFRLKQIRTLRRITVCYQKNGQFEKALDYARRLLAFEPWNEEGHQQVMGILSRMGRRTEAIAQYEICCQVLKDELDVEPSGHTQKLVEYLLSDNWQSEELPLKAVIAPKAFVARKCPYRGLSSFREEDASLFFGRQYYIEQLLEKVKKSSPGVGLVGSSGSGKSSVVFAGLIPRLRQDPGWMVASFRPGAQPFHSLAVALQPLVNPFTQEKVRLPESKILADDLLEGRKNLRTVFEEMQKENNRSEGLLIVVDQFEELFTLCADSETRRQFIDCLFFLEGEDGKPDGKAVVVLFVLRADFVGQVLAYRPFIRLLQESTLMLGGMIRTELCLAIEKPAENAGVLFEPGLVERILDNIGEESGKLPLLEFALTLLWDRQQNGVMSHSGFEGIGQIEGALTGYADQVYLTLNEKDQSRARNVFLQLVQPGLGTGDTRRISTCREIGAENWALVQYLADKRLVITGQDNDGNEIAEIVHEALISGWNRLQSWLETNRAFRVWQEGLRAAIKQWEGAQKDQEMLWRGAQLNQAENWVNERGDLLNEFEVEFIQAGTALHERKLAEQEMVRERELEAARKLAVSELRSRRFLVALVILLIAASAIASNLAAISFRQRRIALDAYSLSLAANAREALQDDDSSTALVLALAGNRIKDPPLETQRVLMQAAYAPGPIAKYKVGDLFDGLVGPVTCVAISPDGNTALAGLQDGSIVYWELFTGKPIRRIYGHIAQVNEIVFNPDGTSALSAGDDGQVITWNLASGKELSRFTEHSGAVRVVDLSPDGSTALSGGFSGGSGFNPGELILWHPVTGEVLRRFLGHKAGIVDAKFSPDGSKILAASGDPSLILIEGSANIELELILWDVQSGSLLRQMEAVEHDACSIAFLPDGTRALSGSLWDHILTLWDLTSGKKLAVYDLHEDGVRGVVISPDGTRALSASEDDSVIQWDLKTGKVMDHFQVHNSGVLALAISPNGRTALSGSYEGELIVWDLFDAAEVRRFEGHEDMVFDVAFMPDGKRLVSVSGGATPGLPSKDVSIRVWDIETGDLLKTLGHPSPPSSSTAIFQVAVSPDGKTALTASSDSLVRLWDLETGEEIRTFTGHDALVTSVEFTPDGSKGLSASVDQTLILWDIESGQPLHRFFGHTEGIWAVTISPDGRTALSGADDGSMIEWSLETGREISRHVNKSQLDDAGVSGIAYLPDPSKVIFGQSDGYLIEWDLKSSREIRRFGPHTGFRTRVYVDQEGRTAFTCSWDGELMLWDLGSGELIRQFGQEGEIAMYDIAMSKDGMYGLTGSSDGEIILWRLMNPSFEELMTWIGENRSVRELSCKERSLYQIEPLCEN